MRPSSSLTMRLTEAVLVLIATCGTGYATSETEEPFTTFFLSPYITKKVPPVKLLVRFSSEVVNLGNKIPAYSASIPPYIYYEAEPDALYSIIIIDADTTFAGAPIGAQYLLALLLNIPGNEIAKANYMTPYTPVNPYVGSGYHRIVIYLFKQSKKIDITSPELQSLPTNLIKFSVEKFAKKYELGDPIAGNFFLSQLIVCDEDEDIPQKCPLYTS